MASLHHKCGEVCSRSNVLLEAAPLIACLALVPTINSKNRTVGSKLSVGAIATGLSIAVGSANRSLTLWVLAAPPGASKGSKCAFKLDDTMQLATPAPLNALCQGKSATGQPLLYGGTSAGTVICWDVATWQLKQSLSFPAHTHECSGLVTFGAHNWLAAAYTDGTVKVWPHGAVLYDKTTTSHTSSIARGIACISYAEEEQILVASARKIHIWNPVLAERVITLNTHNDTLVHVSALPQFIISCDVAGVIHITDALCYEHLQTIDLLAGPIPLNVSPFLHQAFMYDYESGEILVAAAGALTLLRRVVDENLARRTAARSRRPSRAAQRVRAVGRGGRMVPRRHARGRRLLRCLAALYPRAH